VVNLCLETEKMRNKIKNFILLTIFVFFLFLSWQTFAQENLEIEYPTIPGTEKIQSNTSLPSYLKYVYNLSVFLAGILSFVLLVWGGIKYITSANRPGKMADAKEQISAAFLGLIIVLASFLILNSINPELLILNMPDLKILEIIPYSPPQKIELPEYVFQEIPVGTLITSEISISSFITVDDTDPSYDSEEYEDAFPDTISYSTNYQGALHGRRLKRVHEVASTTMPVADYLELLYGEFIDIMNEMMKEVNQLYILGATLVPAVEIVIVRAFVIARAILVRIEIKWKIWSNLYLYIMTKRKIQILLFAVKWQSLNISPKHLNRS